MADGAISPDRVLDADVAEYVMGWSGRIEVSKARSLKSAKVWKVAFKDRPAIDGQFNIGDYSFLVDRSGKKISCGRPHLVHYPPRYHEDAKEDLEVLACVRRSWGPDQRVRFVDALCRLWGISDSKEYSAPAVIDMVLGLCTNRGYDVGDFARAALVAMTPDIAAGK